MGFCRTNLFKRLESGGPAFIESIERHILRNFIYLYAVENALDLPLGTQDVNLLDSNANDEDEEALLPETADENEGATVTLGEIATPLRSEADFRTRAEQVYKLYTHSYKRRFKWLRPSLFSKQLGRDLLSDARSVLTVLQTFGIVVAIAHVKLVAVLIIVTHQVPN